MFIDKALEYMKSNRALQLWHRMRNDEIEILKDFAVWLDEQDAEKSVQSDEVTTCPKCGRDEFWGGRCHVVGCGSKTN